MVVAFKINKKNNEDNIDIAFNVSYRYMQVNQMWWDWLDTVWI